MKRIITILLLSVLSITPFCGRDGSFTPGNEAVTDSTYSRINDSCKAGIDGLSDRLHCCSFELPQGNSIRFGRQDEHNQQRHVGNSRVSFCTTAQSEQQKPSISRCYIIKEVAESRHARGYYIYALRHIII